MAHAKFKVGDLQGIVGDNEGHGEHRAGYNGLHWLSHKNEPETLFVPTVAGMNLEHIFDGHQELSDVDGARQIFFEPRKSPMTLNRISEAEFELHQPPTPTFHLESWTRFRIVAPHYFDFEFRCRATQHVFRHGYIGLFWASYMNAPDDKSIYFRNRSQWQQLCTQRHEVHSTARPRENRFELAFTKGLGESLYQSMSHLSFDEPFYYGLFREQVAIFMFEPALLGAEGPHLRFTHSPSGGGASAPRQTTNPAWDFQFIIPDYDVMRDYGFRARLAYRPRCSREEILAEVKTWTDSLAKPGQ